jgi:hypothetical protein
MPVIEQLAIRDDEVRIIAALHAQRRPAGEAAERLIALLDELDRETIYYFTSAPPEGMNWLILKRPSNLVSLLNRGRR